MMASLVMQQKETLTSAKMELEDRGVNKQEMGERDQIPSWHKAGEAF